MPLKSQFIPVSQMWQKDGHCVVRSVSAVTEMKAGQAEDACAVEKATGILIACNWKGTTEQAGWLGYTNPCFYLPYLILLNITLFYFSREYRTQLSRGLVVAHCLTLQQLTAVECFFSLQWCDIFLHPLLTVLPVTIGPVMFLWKFFTVCFSIFFQDRCGFYCEAALGSQGPLASMKAQLCVL